jgi:hypothetical protein
VVLKVAGDGITQFCGPTSTTLRVDNCPTANINWGVYSWSGLPNLNLRGLTVNQTQTIIVSCSDNICANSPQLQLTVSPPAAPTSISVNPSNPQVNQSFTLTANGCGVAAVWASNQPGFNSAVSTPSITISSATAATYQYSASCQLGNCVSLAGANTSVIIQAPVVNCPSPPLLTANGTSNNLTVSTGSTVNFLSTGCDNGGTKVWNNGLSANVQSLVFQNTGTNSYTFTCTKAGCTTQTSSVMIW